jgi:hypothetical protein
MLSPRRRSVYLPSGWLPVLVFPVSTLLADRTVRAVSGVNCFAASNAGVVVSNTTRGINFCVRLFCACAVLCISSGLATD